MFDDLENGSTSSSSSAPAEKPSILSIALIGTAAYYSGDTVDKLSQKFGGLILVDPEDQKEAVAQLREQMVAAAVAKFGSPSLKGLQLGVRRSDEKKADGSAVFKHPSFANKLVLTARSQKPISTFFGPNRTQCEPNQVEGGDLVVAEVRPFAYLQGGNKGISLGLNAIWLLEKGKVKISRGGSAGSTFGNVNLGNFKFGGAGASAKPSEPSDDEGF